jgi:hypothetical protein
MAEDPVFVQMNLLKFFGFLPIQNNSRQKDRRVFISLQNFLLLFLAAFFLIGGTICLTFQVAIAINLSLFLPSASLLFKLCSMLPKLTLFGRPVMILLILLSQRSSHRWLILTKTVQSYVGESFPEGKIRNQLQSKIRRLSVWVFVITFILHVLWWIWNLQLDFSIKGVHADFFAEDAFFPLPVKLTYWQYQVIWSLFCIVDFILSQQVLIILLLLAHILTISIQTLTEDIEAEITKYSVNPCEIQLVDQEDLEEKILQWKKRCVDSHNFCDLLNGCFSTILFFSYGCDFVSSFGYAANVMINLHPSLNSYAFYVTSTLLFCSYTTIFLVPLVSAHEQVKVKAKVDPLLKTEYSNVSRLFGRGNKSVATFIG